MSAKTLSALKITETVRTLLLDAARQLPPDVVAALDCAYAAEESTSGKAVLRQLLDNKDVALNEGLPLCQDTGLAVVFVEWGVAVCFDGDDIIAAINEGVRRAYEEGFLRKSIVSDPLFDRKNTGDNTPSVVHFAPVPGDSVRITVAPKGGGSENMSAIRMLKPSEGVEGVKRFVIDTVLAAGGNPCPPIIVGVGIGGTFEAAALISKKSLLRELGQPNPDPRYASIERELLDAVNRTGIGPMGFGGRVTALAVHVEYLPCHLASLPVAVNIQCNSARHKEAVL